MPYFMDHAEFIQCTGDLTLESMLSYDMPPDPSLIWEVFLDLLR